MYYMYVLHARKESERMIRRIRWAFFRIFPEEAGQAGGMLIVYLRPIAWGYWGARTGLCHGSWHAERQRHCERGYWVCRIEDHERQRRPNGLVCLGK
jgi:hypothetical protein